MIVRGTAYISLREVLTLSKRFIHNHDYPIASTKDGLLHGYEWDGVLYFMGIRYAVAKRFHMPEPVEPWEGIRMASTPGPTAPVFEQGVPASDFYVPHRYWPTDENCQYLNVWTKSLDPSAKKPVMVWIHGGGFSSGSAMEGVSYDCDDLARVGDVVTVSVNHRLNLLGYFDLSSFGEEYKNSVNAGIADLVEALRWIRRNIAAFGGDPDNVMIFGQSGGGGKIITLLQTPAADGLYHKAAIISGAANLGGTGDLDHRALALQMLKELNFREDQVRELEDVPYDILMEACKRAGKALGVRPNWGPRKNDYYLGYPTLYGFSEYAKTVPVIVGTALGEFNAYGPKIPSWIPEEEKREKLNALYQGHADEVIEAFHSVYPGKDVAVISQLDTAIFRQGAQEFLDQRLKDCPNTPTWAYLFGLVFSINDGTPCWHSGDIPFFTHTTSRIPNANFEGLDGRLEADASGSMLSFARNNDPNHDGMPFWPAYDPEDEATMIFDVRSHVVPHGDKALRDAMKGWAPEARDPRPPKKESTRPHDRIWYY